VPSAPGRRARFGFSVTIFDDQLLEACRFSDYFSRMKIAGALIAVLALAGCPNDAHNEAAKLNTEGNKALGQKQYETAINDFEKAVEKNHDYHLAWYGLGVAYYQKNDYAKAVDALEKCVQLAPEQPMYQMMYGVALYEKGVDSAKDEQAHKANKKKEEIDPDLSGVNFEKSQQHLQEAIKLNPDMWRAHYYMGRIYRAGDKAKEAAEQFTQAIKGDPREWAPYVALSELYLKWDYADQAIQVASQGVANVPGSNDTSEIWYDLGMAYDAKKMEDKAIEAFTKAVETKRDNHKAKFQRGQAYFRKGDMTNAKRDLEDFNKSGGASLEFIKQQASQMLMQIAAKQAGADHPADSGAKQSPEDVVKKTTKAPAGGPPPKKK
jgi:tetratricopeptide (TPR) repeat protein